MSEPSDSDGFLAEAKRPRAGLVRELWELLRDNKKWWLAPILLSLLALAALALFGSSAAAPFIYTLF